MNDGMDVEASEAVRRSAAALGGRAARWLDEVPTLLAEISDAWDLELGAQLHHEGMNSVVVGATTRDGVDAVLKLALPHDDARDEAAALRLWSGRGAVRLLRSTPDGFTLLLQRCRPGHDLWRLPIDAQIDVVADLLPRLWITPAATAAVRHLSHTTARWERRMSDEPHAFDAPAELVARSAGWVRDLRDPRPRVLLHGDLNPGNVLAAAGGEWVAIDPKPWLGDPAFDCAQLLVNWVRIEGASGDGAARATARRAARLAEPLGLDVGRVLRWAAVKAVGWRAGRDHALVLDAAARAHGA